jgi:integrase
LLTALVDTVPAIEKLTAKDLYDAFVNCDFSRDALKSMKIMLAFLFESGLTKVDFSVCVPKKAAPKPYPSVYTGKEIAQLLSSMDRTSSIGKRDYAILTIAAYLGMRWSDIANLEFSNIDYVGKSIKIIQVKTLSPLTLVLNDNVETAILDYIQNGRPQSKNNKIFLSSVAPFDPLGSGAGYAIAQAHFGLAEVPSKGRRLGTHALRASYATALIAKGLPYVVAQKALGHASPQSMKHYARVDIARLRECAIDVPALGLGYGCFS